MSQGRRQPWAPGTSLGCRDFPWGGEGGKGAEAALGSIASRWGSRGPAPGWPCGSVTPGVCVTARLAERHFQSWARAPVQHRPGPALLGSVCWDPRGL